MIWAVPDERIIDPLIRLMADPAPEVRRSAMWSLSSLPFQRAEEATSSFVNDPEEMVRIFLAQSIPVFKFVSYLDLLPRLFADPSPSVHCIAIAGMRSMYQQYQPTPLRDDLDSQLGVSTSVKAARAPEVLRLARQLLSDPDEEVRNEASRAVDACLTAMSRHNGKGTTHSLQLE